MDRYERIMRMIDQGMTDQEIADTLRAEAEADKRWRQNRECDAVTISVYRRAHDGTLAPAGGDAHRTDEDRTGLAASAARLRADGMKLREIAEIMGLTVNQVDHKIRRHRKKTKKRKEPAVEEEAGGVKQDIKRLGLDEREAVKLMMKYGDDAARDAIARALIGTDEEDEP